MSSAKNKFNCAQANEMDLVDYLSSLGFKPSKIRNTDHWYLSPFRREDTPSFKVNRQKNVWYDHGDGSGGTLIDFGLRYFNCSVPDFLEKLSINSPFHPLLSSSSTKSPTAAASPLVITGIHPINSLDLLLYLKDRRIDFSIAIRYCKQVVFEIDNKFNKALGFANDQGGYELRNASFKASSSPKSPTTFLSNADTLLVFEGFFDFLSYQMINQNQDSQPADFLILNSTAFFEKSRPAMENYSSVRLLLDHDPTGEKFTQQALSWGPKYEDHSSLYQGHKDLNEWLQSAGKSQANQIRPRLR